MIAGDGIQRRQDKNVFINPPPAGPPKDYSANPAYALNAIVDISWTTNYTEYDLIMWQDLDPCTQSACANGPYVLSSE